MTTVTITAPHPLAGTPATLVSTRHSATPVYMLRLGKGARGAEGQDLEGIELPVHAGSFVETESEERHGVSRTE